MMHYHTFGNSFSPGYSFGYDLMSTFGAILHLIFWLIIIMIIIRFVRRRRGGLIGDRRHIWMHSSALDILKERYAKGEINKAEFEEKKKDLE